MTIEQQNLRKEITEESHDHGAWTAEGYIQNQDLLEGYIYRTIPAKENSCGPIAVYNLCRHMGRELQFEDLLREMDGMHLLHMPGPTLMHVMRRCLTKYLPGWQEVHGRVLDGKKVVFVVRRLPLLNDVPVTERGGKRGFGCLAHGHISGRLRDRRRLMPGDLRSVHFSSWLWRPLKG